MKNTTRKLFALNLALLRPCCGKLTCNWTDGAETTPGRFPPRGRLLCEEKAQVQYRCTAGKRNVELPPARCETFPWRSFGDPTLHDHEIMVQ